MDNAKILLNPKDLEQNRDLLISNYQVLIDEINTENNRILTAKNVLNSYDENMIDENILAVDIIAFVKIDVFEENMDNFLFGEVSKIIEESVDEEINEMNSASTEKTFQRQITPDRLIKSSEFQKEKIFDKILNDNIEVNAITIRYMQLYNEISQDIDSISERSKKKVEENKNLLYLISSKYKYEENISQNYINDSYLYTIAFVSNIKDSNQPSLNKYKENMIDKLNQGINSLVKSKNIHATISVMESSVNVFNDCQDYIKDIESRLAKNTVLTIEAMKESYQEKNQEIQKLYSAEIQI